MLINDLLGIIRKNHWLRTPEEHVEMSKFIRRIKFFENFIPKVAEEAQGQFIKSCSIAVRHELFVTGDILYHYGDKTDKIFFMLSGQVAQFVPKTKEEMKREKENFNLSHFLKKKKPHILLINNNRRVFYSHKGILTFKRLKFINSGNDEGDVVTIFEEGLKQSTTTVCTKDSHCMSLTKSDFENCFLPTIDVDSRSETSKSLMSVFPQVARNQIDLLAFMIEHKRFEFNERVYEQGSEPEELFLIRSGEFLLSRSARIPCANGKRSFTEIFVQKAVCQGELIGEYEIIMREERRLNSATCISKDGATVFSVEKGIFNLFRGFILEVISSLVVGAKIKDNHLQEMIEKKAEILEKFQNGVELIEAEGVKNKGPERSVHYFKSNVKTVESNLGRRGLSPSHIAGVDPLRAVRNARSNSPKREDPKSPEKGHCRAKGLDGEGEKRRLLGQVLKTNFCTLKNVPYRDDGEDCLTCGPKSERFYRNSGDPKINSFHEKEQKSSKFADIIVKNIDIVRYKDKLKYKKMILQNPVEELNRMIKVRVKKMASPSPEEEKRLSESNLDDNSLVFKAEKLPEIEPRDFGTLLPHFVFLKNKLKKLKTAHSKALGSQTSKTLPE